MATFNTYDYEFLLKCLSEGSIIFKAEAIKRLNTLAGADKKQFVNHLRSVMSQLQTLYKQDKQEVNYHSIMLLNQIISNIQSKQVQNLLFNKHLALIVPALGHPTKTALRKAAHTVLLNSIKSYPLFHQLVNIYIHHGFQSQNQLVCQKSINSFQSIFILEVKNFDWFHQTSILLLETLIKKIQNDSLFISKAASQCVLSICKMESIKKIVPKLQSESIRKLKRFMEELVQKMSADTFYITPNELQMLLNSNKLIKQQKIQNKKINKNTPSSSSQQEPEERFSPIKNNSNNHRRLQKIKKSIKNEEKKVQKQNHGAKLFSFITGEGSLKQRTQAMQDLLYKIQVSKSKPQFQSSMKAIFPTLLKMLKDNNPKIVSLTLRIIQNCIQWIAGNENQINNLVNVIVEKLGDQKISIRQNVSKVIKQLANKTNKGIWIKQLLDNLKKNTSNALKDETLYLIHYIYESSPRQQQINFPTCDIIEQISKYTDDPKTKIKIRTLDCLSVIVFHSKQSQKYNYTLKNKMSSVFYQMYLQKLGKLQEEILKKNQQMQKKSKKQQMQKMNQQNYRTIYKQNRNGARSQGQNEQALNVSMEIVKKRVSALRKPRNLLSTQQTISVDGSATQKNNDRSMEDLQIVLPSLYKKTGNKFISTKKYDFTPNKTIENKQSDYLSKDDLKPLRDPQKQMKNLMVQLKSSDWKIQFQSINKLRRLIEFNSNIILETSTANIHALVLDMLSLVENLRSSVAKNSLICMGQFISIMGKQIDLEMQIILEKLVKKSADTNVFISSQVQKCLNILATNCTPNKFLQKLAAYRQSKSVSVKQAIVSTLLVMKNHDRIRQKQFGKLAQSLAFYIQDSQLQVRSKAKLGVVQLSKQLGDWYRALRGKINPIYFKCICQLMTKSPLKRQQDSNIIGNNTINVSSLQNKPNYQSKYASQEKPIRQTIQSPLKKKYVKIATFPEQFNEIQSMLQLSNSPDWKKKIQVLTKIKQIALQFPNQFTQYRSSTHFIDCLCKQITEPNVKVCLNALNTFLDIFNPLRSIVEANLGIICNSVFGALNSNKIEIKELAQKSTMTLLQGIQLNNLIQFLCHGSLYSLPRSRVYLLQQITQRIQIIHDQKRQLLYKNIFPLLNKLMEEYKSQIMPHVICIYQKIYQIMGNAMFGHISKFKEVRQLIDK